MVCGEYLRWEPTRALDALTPSDAGAGATAEEAEQAGPSEPSRVSPEPVGDPDVTLPPGAAAVAPVRPDPVAVGAVSGSAGRSQAQTEAPPDAATLLLRLPDDDAAATGPVSVAVKPGERVIVLGLIRNESGIVDNYDIAVSGLPEGWWTVAPATAYLVPYGSSGTYEQEIQIHLHPPRVPQAEARPWSIEVVARSRAYETQVAGAPATATIEPYQDVAAKLTPDRASGRLKARFKLTVRNRANAPAEVALSAEDTDGELEFRFAQPTVTVEAGRGVEAPFTVFPPKQIWLGRPKDRSIRVTATPVGVEQPPPPLPGTYRQKSWLPWWLAVVAPVAAAIVAAIILLAPKQTVVPNLTKAQSVFDAQKMLIPLGLKLQPQPALKPTAGARPGAIVAQAPAAGTKVKKGTSVLVTVAVAGAKTVKVPSVVGLTPVTADTTLRAAGLMLGAVSPQPPNPNGTIATQIPATGTVAAGTPVAVFLKLPKSTTAGTGTNTTSGNGASNGNGAPKAVAIPAIAAAGGTIAAAAKLSQAGLVPTTIKQFSSAPAGTLVGTNPPAGKSLAPGTKVTVIVSAGFPQVSFDNHSAIKLVDGASGKATVALPPPPPGQLQDEASWSADGSKLVYVQGPVNGGQLMQITPGQKGAQPTAVTASGSNARYPAFAPAAASNVLAFIGGGGKKLCFGTVGPNPLNPNCTSHPGWTLGRQVAWAPGGREILVFGVQNGRPGTFGLIQFLSNVANSGHATDWGQGKVVTSTSTPQQGVIAGAFSPDGKQIALLSNIGGGSFHVVLAPRGDYSLAPPAKVTAIAGCRVAWRPDGQALAVVVAQASCTSNPIGDIGVVNIHNLVGIPKAIATNADNPVWQPLSLSG
ncbi:MAG: PASTA domain-containing protein [Solirubrobacteraceae bacterium]